MLKRIWFYIKWTYIVLIGILIIPATRDLQLIMQGQVVDWSDWKFMLVSGLQYNWIIGLFAYSIEVFMDRVIGKVFSGAPEPEQDRKVIFPPRFEPETVDGEVIEGDLQTITAHSYNRLQLGSGPLKWVSERLDDLRNGGLWTPKFVDKVMCPTCGNAQWASLLVDDNGNWVKKYQCKTCETTFNSNWMG